MPKDSQPIKFADSYEEIKHLVELCKAGRLFDVQDWIAAGKPVNLPLEREKRARRSSPLKIAMEKGFHSLVQVLVEGGAQFNEQGFSALHHAVSERRLDFIELLVENVQTSTPSVWIQYLIHGSLVYLNILSNEEPMSKQVTRSLSP